MNIAEVTATFPPYYGGIGNVAYHNARLLAQRGHRVTVFTQRPNTAVLDDRSLPFHVTYLEPAWSIGNAPLLPGLFRSLEGFDLIHLHYPFIFGTEMVLHAAKRHKTPLLVSYHNRLVEQSFVRRTLFAVYNSIIEPKVLTHSTNRIAVNHDHFSSLFPHVSAIEVPNGVDTQHFSPIPPLQARQLLGLSPTAPIILFVGGLDLAHRFKNVPGLLRATASIEKAYIIVVGRGELQAPLRTLAQSLRMANRTRFVDTCTTEQLPLYYSASDITVLPSNRTESFGMVLVESMACGTPVIATDLPGVRQIVNPPDTGLIVPTNDDSALKDAIWWMLDHGAERQAMGNRGNQYVKTHYAWPIIGEKLENACLQTIRHVS